MGEIEKQLTDVIRAPIRNAADAEKAARAAEALAELLRAAERAGKLLSAESRLAEMPDNRGLAGKTLPDAAEAVLEEIGRPLHAKELGERIKAGGWVHPRGQPSRPDQIVYQLAARLPRYPRRFKRVAPNTFALADWDGEPRPGAPKPKTALFKGPGGNTGRSIGDSDKSPARDDAWRSS